MLFFVLALQAAATASERPSPPARDFERFDLAAAKPAARDSDCGIEDAGSDIVVCSRKKIMDIDTSRMPAFAEKPVRTTIDLPGGVKAGVGTTARKVGNFPSNAIMGKVKIPF